MLTSRPALADMLWGQLRYQSLQLFQGVAPVRVELHHVGPGGIGILCIDEPRHPQYPGTIIDVVAADADRQPLHQTAYPIKVAGSLFQEVAPWTLPGLVSTIQEKGGRSGAGF